jgi:hypothetical protein
VKTASGATAVQIVEKRRGVRRILEHVGSAHDDAELAVLIATARDRIHAGQQALDLDTAAAASAGAAVVTGSASEVLWTVLVDAYCRLGFDQLADEAFRALVLARIVEPTSTSAAVGVLDELGVAAPHRNTFTAALARCVANDYRAALAGACMAVSRRSGAASLVLYDVTTLHFEVEHEDPLRKVGMSKERACQMVCVTRSSRVEEYTDDHDR